MQTDSVLTETRPKPSSARPKASRWRRVAFWGWIVACSAFLAYSLPRHEWRRLNLRFLNSQPYEELGGFGYVCFDLFDIVSGTWRDSRLSSLDPGPYREYLAKLAAGRSPSIAPARPKKHVIFLQMESADGLVIDARYQTEPVVPFLDKLAHEQLYFATNIDNTAGGRTTDAELMVLTSLVPLRRLPAYVSEPLDRVPSLPKVLGAAGYDTWSMHGYGGSFWRRRRAHQSLGFAETFFEDQLDRSDRVGWGISDRSVLHQAAQRLKAATQPTFAHVILLTNHFPCMYVRQWQKKPEVSFTDDYVISMRYIDSAIEAFFGELAAAGVLDDSIVVLFGDHDSGGREELAEGLEHVAPQAFADTVPLIIYGLDSAPRRIDAVSGLQDVPVIVLEALGLPVPRTFTGHGLDHLGRTVAAMYGSVEMKDGKVSTAPPPVDSGLLTQLSLRYPEKLLAP